MVPTSALVSLAAFALVANAAPSSLARRDGTISSQCTNVRIQERWLVGDCLTGGAGSSRITSGTYLSNKITNDDGVLKWKEDGAYEPYCKDCQLVNGGSDLNCQCRPNFGQSKDTTLKLDEHIGVYNGHLLSDLLVTPVVPKEPSKYPFPSTFVYGIGGIATCAPGSPIPTWCASNAFACSDQAKTDLSETQRLQYNFPHNKCLQAGYYFVENIWQFEKIKMAGVGAWEMVGYEDDACTKEVVKIEPEQMGQCKEPPQLVKSLIVRPLFNGDRS